MILVTLRYVMLPNGSGYLRLCKGIRCSTTSRLLLKQNKVSSGPPGGLLRSKKKLEVLQEELKCQKTRGPPQFHR